MHKWGLITIPKEFWNYQRKIENQHSCSASKEKTMDKIEKVAYFDNDKSASEYIDEEDVFNKVNELVEENSKIRMRIAELEDIVKYHIEKLS